MVNVGVQCQWEKVKLGKGPSHRIWGTKSCNKYFFLANINKTKSPVLVHGKKHARHQTSEAAFLKQNFIHLTSDHLLDYFRIMIYDYDVGNMYFFQHYLSVCHWQQISFGKCSRNKKKDEYKPSTWGKWPSRELRSTKALLCKINLVSASTFLCFILQVFALMETSWLDFGNLLPILSTGSSKNDL